MPNSTVQTSVSGNTVTIVVSIGTGDPASHGIYISSKQDHGLGSSGYPDYPYFVEKITSSTTHYSIQRTLSNGNYVAVLALQGLGDVDYSIFDIGGGCQPDKGQSYCSTQIHTNDTVCSWNGGTCAYDCVRCTSPQYCEMRNGVATCVGGDTAISYDCISGQCRARNDQYGFFPDLNSCQQACRDSTTTSVKVSISSPGSGDFVVVYKNGVQLATVTGPQTFSMNASDTLKLVAVGRTGYVFDKWCNSSGGNCFTTNPIEKTVGSVTLDYVAYFKQSGGNGVGTATINVWRMTGAGEISAYKGSTLLGTTSNGIGSFTFNVGDTFKFVATAGSGWTFEKYCSADPCSGGPSTTSNPFTGTVAQSGNLYVYFKASGGNGCVSTGIYTCEPGQTGYEVDNCGTRRANPICGIIPIPTKYYRCDTVNKICIEDSTLTSNRDNCAYAGQTCGTGGGIKCPSGKTNLGGLLPGCYSTITVTLVGGLGLILLTRK